MKKNINKIKTFKFYLLIVYVFVLLLDQLQKNTCTKEMLRYIKIIFMFLSGMIIYDFISNFKRKSKQNNENIENPLTENNGQFSFKTEYIKNRFNIFLKYLEENKTIFIYSLLTLILVFYTGKNFNLSHYILLFNLLAMFYFDVPEIVKWIIFIGIYIFSLTITKNTVLSNYLLVYLKGFQIMSLISAFNLYDFSQKENTFIKFSNSNHIIENLISVFSTFN